MNITCLHDLKHEKDMRSKLWYLTKVFGISINHIAKNVKSHRTTLSNYRAGYFKISPELYCRLEQYLNDTYGV